MARPISPDDLPTLMESDELHAGLDMRPRATLARCHQVARR